jgi:mannose-6-phosphate isomerase-like protein (cupin superfamily)
MNELLKKLQNLNADESIEKAVIVKRIIEVIHDTGYAEVEVNDQKPWGAYIRLDSLHADRFVDEFFPGLSPIEARLGSEQAELSPKILLVSPSQRLSWQFHNRRAERWTFLSDGAFERSLTDEESNPIIAQKGDVVQFAQGERHRLIGVPGRYVMVAEIWQHTDANDLSNEEDIIRLADDYVR